ncbi:MAG: FG-GAP repeat domain-containing protein [Actinomycetota bacterium]
MRGTRGSVLIASAILLLSTPAPTTSAAADTTCGPTWTTVPARPTKNINGLDALSSTNAWGVGIEFGSPEPSFSSRTTDGVAWKRVASPNRPDSDTGLNKVSFVNPHDGWAVGYSGDFISETPPWSTLALHWNGQRWRPVKTPRLSGSNSFTGVDALGPNDVWAAGYQKNGSARMTLIEHWNGTRWTVIPSPSPSSTSAGLTALSGSGKNDVWAVGYFREGHRYRPLTLHWNGTRWNVVPSPASGPGESVLTGVSASAHANVWAVGYRGPSDSRLPLTLRWDGQHWSTVPAPSTSFGYDALVGVAARSRGDAWAVGFSFDTGASLFHPLAERWNGSSWEIVPTPEGQGVNSELIGVTIAPDTGQVWAGGRSGIFGLFMTICPTANTPVVQSPARDHVSSSPGRLRAAPSTSTAEPNVEPTPVPKSRAIKVVARSREKQAGISEITRSRGAVVFDYDGDHWPDFLLGRHQFAARLYHNDGNGHFTEVSPGEFKAIDRHYCSAADVNADGQPDVFCATGANKGSELKQNELWIQQPDHSFVNEASRYGVADVFGRGRDEAFLDLNGDGYPELFLGDSGDRPDGIPSPNRFFLNRNGERYQEGVSYDLNKEFGDSCGQSFDYNLDGHPDLLLCTTSGLRLYEDADGGHSLVDVTSKTGLGQHVKDATVADFNGDGWPDIAILTQDDHLRVALQEHGTFELAFRTPLGASGVSIAAGDVNRDGRPDLYIARGHSKSLQNAPDLMLLDGQDGHDFEPMRIPSVPTGSAESVSPIDYDRNGLTDFIVTNGQNGTLPGPVQLLAFFPAN